MKTRNNPRVIDVTLSLIGIFIHPSFSNNANTSATKEILLLELEQSNTNHNSIFGSSLINFCIFRVWENHLNFVLDFSVALNNFVILLILLTLSNENTKLCDTLIMVNNILVGPVVLFLVALCNCAFVYFSISKAKDSMTEPSLDIVEDILLRLEVNDHIRCKSVCKSWNSLILSPRFVKSHINYNLNEILLRLQVKDVTRYKLVCKSWNSLISSPRFAKSHLNYNLKKKVDNNEIGDTRIIASGDGEYQVVGSSNGLVCISRNVTEFLVVNPSTHEVKELRNPPLEYEFACVSGFGYDSSIDDYKVVAGFLNESRTNYVFKVLTLKSNVWRSVAVESGYDNLDGNGILCNGAIHWTSFDQNDEKVIVSFDLSKEVFKEIPQPKLGPSDWDLGTMKDCLCIFASPAYIYRDIEDIGIWVMRCYNVQESWERKLPTPAGYDTYKTMMDYNPRKDFFNRHLRIWVLEIERPHHEHLHGNAYIFLSTISDCNYNFDEHVFVKSLVSPHGMGDGDGGDGNINDVNS
ncbi:F-box domain-containing protein [Artemisia annua]|uniref:F-box domain-containing protein n=1 Tax=Artemisia annua TaxID=35608 RepID=A0A2U1Q2L7_ARTAN|nr:F-box domain-containing protein [Artemisia annua]